MKGQNDMLSSDQIATLRQAQAILDLIMKIRPEPTKQDVQQLLENSDLLKSLLQCPDLKKVNRQELEKLLAVGQIVPSNKNGVQIHLTPVSELAELISKRSAERGWGFTDEEIDAFASSLHGKYHEDDLHPISASIWLGTNFSHMWDEAVLWYKDSLKSIGLDLVEDPRPDSLTFFRGSEITGDRKLSVACLDFKSNWDPNRGLIPNRVVENEREEGRMPSIEPLIFMALNPHMFYLMDGKAFPYLVTIGVYFKTSYNRIVRIGKSYDKPCVQYKVIVAENLSTNTGKMIGSHHQTLFEAAMVTFSQKS